MGWAKNPALLTGGVRNHLPAVLKMLCKPSFPSLSADSPPDAKFEGSGLGAEPVPALPAEARDDFRCFFLAPVTTSRSCPLLRAIPRPTSMSLNAEVSSTYVRPSPLGGQRDKPQKRVVAQHGTHVSIAASVIH